MKLLLRLQGITLILIFTLLLSACANSSKPNNTATSNSDSQPEQSQQTVSDNGTSDKVQEPKILNIGIVNAPVTLNQINTQDNSASLVPINLINDALLDVTESAQFIPKLAESIETKDKQTYRVKLKSNAKWNDGTPFTTTDVAFTLKIALHPKVDTSFKLQFIEGVNDFGKLDEGITDIKGLHVIDSTTFEIKTKTPIDPLVFNERFGVKVNFLPQHILKDIDPEQLATHEYFQKPTITIGPYKFANYEQGQYVEVTKNENYYLDIPKIDTIFIKVLPAANLVAQLQTGEIALNSLPVGLVPITDYDKVTSFENVNVTSASASEPAELFFNIERLPDKKVRQAIAHALNRPLIVEQLLKGQAEIIDGGIPSSHPYFNKDIEPYNYDPEKAKKLLQEAGWDSDRKLVFLIPVGNKVREQAADILVQNLESVGLKIDVQKFDFPTLIDKVEKGEHDITIFTRDYYIEPSLYFTTYRSYDPDSVIRYNNPLVDKLIQQGEQEIDEAKRHDIYNHLQEILHDEVPTLAVYSEKRLQVVSKNVLVGKPLNLGTFNNVNQWDLTTE
ncbi:peptide/nickel transport system substrate-binding protein [Fontibacillus solani]|uniref:Peptide/nickel transport system substrate-binding protein n=1 Tax=Fontibacillus solani TaxID=1572857 RepID=A0A7W3STZ3_9BACL|nr:ABC transporter substrate-binding protein [Fontibacillus solani]MBA9086216.1 peptide/nickel transport system substrate-binding protein [Fontibacillus solani]